MIFLQQMKMPKLKARWPMHQVRYLEPRRIIWLLTDTICVFLRLRAVPAVATSAVSTQSVVATQIKTKGLLYQGTSRMGFSD